MDDKLNAIICKLSCFLSYFIGSNAFSTSNRPRLSARKRVNEDTTKQGSRFMLHRRSIINNYLLMDNVVCLLLKRLRIIFYIHKNLFIKKEVKKDFSGSIRKSQYLKKYLWMNFIEQHCKERC